MNQAQFLGILRIVVPVLLSYLVGAGIIPSSVTTELTTTIVTLGSIGWTIFAHTSAAKVAAVAALPDTEVLNNGKTIQVLTTKLAEVAKDNATPYSVA
jgi:hypothetical protein